MVQTMVKIAVVAPMDSSSPEVISFWTTVRKPPQAGICVHLNFGANYCTHISVHYCCLGINKGKFDDGYFLPHTHGFDYVGTILPFTLMWSCDTSKVRLHFGNFLALFL